MHHPEPEHIKSHPGGDPSAMVNKFQEMPVHNPHLFTIKRLNVPNSRANHPMPPVRTEIHCFVFLTKGETLITVGDQSYLFKANECAIIPAGQTFSVRYFNDCCGFMGGFHTDFLNADNEGKNLLRTFGFLRKWGSHKVLFDQQHGQYVANIFERLYTENNQGKNRDILKAYLTTLLVEIDESYKNHTNGAEGVNTDNQLCNRFLEFVFEQPNQSLSIADHASRLNVTPAHLQKTIKTLTGKTPLAWISEAVLLEAKTILTHTELPINEVAEKVGISDPSYFTRLFKKQTGVTPNIFRNKLKSPKIG